MPENPIEHGDMHLPAENQTEDENWLDGTPLERWKIKLETLLAQNGLSDITIQKIIKIKPGAITAEEEGQAGRHHRIGDIGFSDRSEADTMPFGLAYARLSGQDRKNTEFTAPVGNFFQPKFIEVLKTEDIDKIRSFRLGSY